MHAGIYAKRVDSPGGRTLMPSFIKNHTQEERLVVAVFSYETVSNLCVCVYICQEGGRTLMPPLPYKEPHARRESIVSSSSGVLLQRPLAICACVYMPRGWSHEEH